MGRPGDNLEELLANVLRGVNKIVGCNSTNLVVINEAAREMRVRIGATADSAPALAELENLLGFSFRGLAVPIEAATGGLIAQVWQDGAMRESSSLAELVGGALDPTVVDQLEQKAGQRRILVVPAFGSRQRYGVLLFEKPGQQAFTRQQREVLLRYARRVGEILENDLMGRPALLEPERTDLPECVLLDEHGRPCGQAASGNGLPAEVQRRFGPQVQAWLAGPGAAQTPQGELEDGRQVRCQRFELAGRPAALCWIQPRPDLAGASLENQLLQLTLGAVAPALFLDADFRVTACNPAADKLFDQPPERLIGQGVDALFHQPAGIGELLARQTIFPNAPASEVRAVLRKAQGALVLARLEILPLADAQDRAIGYLLIVRSEEGGQELNSRKLIEQERLATMGEMAAQLAHEIRNPLVAIGATLESLAREPDPQRQRSMVQAASREISRMDMTLRKYLSARSDLTFCEVRLTDLFADVKRLLEGTRRQHGKLIQILVDPGLTLRADYDSMKHVLFNLVLNALEASPPGGEVACRAEPGPDCLNIWVEDRGSGLLAPASQCLEPFFTTKANGTGLGLAVCVKLVQAHGGLLQLSQREGGGCQARVILPGRIGARGESHG